MGFTEAVLTCLRKYATFSGTASRPEYWWFALFSAIGNLVFSLLKWDGVVRVWVLALLLPSLAVGVRRLHDTGRSAWWLLASIIPPWELVLLCLRTKVVGNPYAAGGSWADGTVTNADARTTSSYCPTCGQLRLPGHTYCPACGTALPPA